MTVNELASKIEGKVLSKHGENEISCGCVCDLLSWVMARWEGSAALGCLTGKSKPPSLVAGENVKPSVSTLGVDDDEEGEEVVPGDPSPELSSRSHTTASTRLRPSKATALRGVADNEEPRTVTLSLPLPSFEDQAGRYPRET